MARGRSPSRRRRDIATITDDAVDGVPIRIYRGEGVPTGLVVYFHGGGYVIGSIGIMDNVARELAHASGAVVVSVGYRLAPEHPYPAGLDDCERVTRWALANAARFDVAPDAVAVAGESAGGNLAAGRGPPAPRTRATLPVAAQVLIYPTLSGTTTYPSAMEFDGLVISRAAGANNWAAYSGGRDLDADPYAVPLSAKRLDGLPPGRRDPRRLRHAPRRGSVRTRRVCVRPASTSTRSATRGNRTASSTSTSLRASLAFDHIGAWLRTALARPSGQKPRSSIGCSNGYTLTAASAGSSRSWGRPAR